MGYFFSQQTIELGKDMLLGFDKNHFVEDCCVKIIVFEILLLKYLF